MRRGITILLFATLLAVTPPAALATHGEDLPTDLWIHIPEEGEPTHEAPNATIELQDGEPGRAWTWSIGTSQAYSVAEITIDRAAFEVDRPQQVVPTLDGRHFVILRSTDPTGTDEPATVIRIHEHDDRTIYRLGLPGPGPLELRLAADLDAPDPTLGEPSDIRPIGFHLVTTTDEPAIAELQLRPADAPDDVEWRIDRTPNAAYEQTFPVIGLEANTTYDARLRFWDWARNEVLSDTFQVTTAPEPIAPRPTIEPVDPAPNATLAGGDVTVRARVTSPESPVPTDGVRLFFDKREVPPQDLDLVGDMVVYRPPSDLATGLHSVSLEVTNDAGGQDVRQWTFTVTEPANTPLSMASALLAAALAGVGLVRRLRPGA